MNKKISALLFYFLFSTLVYGQQKPSSYEIMNLPLWAQKMYADNPNVFEIDSLYQSYYKNNTFKKSYHTQYYKRWKRHVANLIDEQGFVNYLTQQQFEDKISSYVQKKSISRSASWSSVGPFFVSSPQLAQGKTQSNVYCIAQSPSNNQVLYCGTEPGEIYKSINGGHTWNCVSLDNYFGSGGSQIWGIGVSAIAIHPTNPDIAFAGGDGGVFKTSNGGNSWSNVLVQSSLGVNEILIHPTNALIVFAATDKGLFKSEDGGLNWTQMFSQKCYDIKYNTADPSILYLVKNNPSLVICEFFRSTDYGVTWSLQSNGWYSSSDPARNDGGARIAVSVANPNRIYAYLIGEAKSNDYGFIGVYRSDDGGINWTLPNGPAGGPYTTNHPNLAYGNTSWTYHQGFYNCAIMASQSNPDQILVGGLNLWRSNDGGVTFSAVAGYVGGPLDLHVDMQDFRAVNGNYWITTDGGIYLSNDFFNSQPEFKMIGLRGSDYWGFGSGWNEDVLVGGLYHNGNLAHHENYGFGNFLSLGGAEDPTGYVNPGKNKKTYHSDIGGVIIPSTYGDPLTYFSIGMSPNQSYYAAESSEMEFHPHCYNIAYLGKDNKLWKTSDGGSSYFLVHEFGTNTNHQIKYIEISSNNPDIMYLNQQPNSGTLGRLWKTTDGGVSWTQLTIPAGNSRRMLITINPTNENELWIAYPNGSNGNKVFKTTDGGAVWTNLSSNILNNESPQSLVYIAGTDGAIYYFTEFAAYYKNNLMSDWVIDNNGLPTYCNVNIARPFYRDHKIRIATYGKGLWEKDLDETSILPIARITVDKLIQHVICDIDSFYFEDYSFLNHYNASWNWSFENGIPATSNLRNPVVFFNSDGAHKATLTITDANGNQSSDSIWVHVNQIIPNGYTSEGFEGIFPPIGWLIFDSNQSGQWSSSSSTGGFGQSANSTIFANYDIDSQGSYDDLRFIFTTTNALASILSFDVAYTAYASNYSDTLEVLISTDCGQTFNSLYKKGGADLATAPFDQNFFVPQNNQWRTETLVLNDYLHEPQLLIAFRNWGYWGNNLYIDNVNLSGEYTNTPNIPSSTPYCSVYPNPTNQHNAIYINFFGTHAEEIALVKVLDMHGKIIYTFSSMSGQAITLPWSNMSVGYYMLNIATEKHIWNKMIYKN